MLAPETVVGLPRSNLVKPQSTAPLGLAPIPVPVPYLAQTSAPAASGSVDVTLEDQLMDTQADIPVTDLNAPSTSDLLERAARLGPARPTFESIVLPNDPILLEKMQPAAAQRRARFRKVVKATLGVCLAVCVIAIGATALSPSEASASQSGASSTATARTAPARPLVTIEKLDEAKRTKALTSHSVTAAVKAKLGKRR